MMEYKRLTIEKEYGCGLCHDRKCKKPNLYCKDRLKCEIYNRLAELEDKIENGTLKEIVRCKDCCFLEEKHYEEDVEKPYIKLVCKLSKKQFQPSDYCSYGEKRLKELQK